VEPIVGLSTAQKTEMRTRRSARESFSRTSGASSSRLHSSTKMNTSQTKSAWLLAISCLAWPGHGQEVEARLAAKAPQPARDLVPGVRLIGRIENSRITESSGVAASRRYPGVFWTHNDGGGVRRQVLYAMTREGHHLGAFPVADVFVADWEDIAIDDDGHLYVADIGNNDSARREIAVHQIGEPDPKAGATVLRPKQTWRLSYPGKPFDSETLFIWRGRGFIVSKVTGDAPAQIFSFPLQATNQPVSLELVTTTKIESPVAGGDISSDGRLLALVAKSGAFIYRIDGDVAKAGKRKPHQIRFKHTSVEGCTFVPEGLLATAESREIFLFTDPVFRAAPPPPKAKAAKED